MDNQEPIEREYLNFELTADQEADMMLEEYEDYATQLAIGVSCIPVENEELKKKVDNLTSALRSFTKEDMLVLFRAIDDGEKKILDEEYS